MTQDNGRKPEYPVSDIFVNRWSPRAFAPVPVEAHKLHILFEAARWATSCYNDQPWYFVYGDNEQTLPKFRGLLVEPNRLWADKAPVLAVLFARKNFTFNGQANGWSEFDAGSAWMSLALQASELGLAAHGMAGFYQDKACEVLGVSAAEFKPMIALAIGYPGEPATLPEALQKIEAPNDRRSHSEMVRCL
ncbi:MAG: nitroreductase family protein [Sedimentisphaerales bacterium]|nr:nitroreductase family protein [Sedimentisphaerales bacterium]MBN2844259.1 nitroreductase family protein [Sedimentisphaerales bacterium]